MRAVTIITYRAGFFHVAVKSRSLGRRLILIVSGIPGVLVKLFM